MQKLWFQFPALLQTFQRKLGCLAKYLCASVACLWKWDYNVSLFKLKALQIENVLHCTSVPVLTQRDP